MAVQLLARGVKDSSIYFKKIKYRMNLIMRMQKEVINLKVRGATNNFSFLNVGYYLSTLSSSIYNSLFFFSAELKLLTTSVFKEVHFEPCTRN